MESPEQQNKVIDNLNKIHARYCEVLSYLFSQNNNMELFSDSFCSKAINKMHIDIISGLTKDPSALLKRNTEHFLKLSNLITNTVSKAYNHEEHKDLIKQGCEDKRFKDAAWNQNLYFEFIKNFYLINAEYFEETANKAHVPRELKHYLSFIINQIVDALSPTNFIFSNPVVLKESLDTGFENLVNGMQNLLSDLKKSNQVFSITNVDKDAFAIGKNVACTKGKVVLQNDLMQLICYQPLEKTYEVPLLIIPPCINKYYILDLSEKNSLVKFLVDSGFQVFLVSFVNPDESHRDKGFDDYLSQCVIEPYEYIQSLGFKDINMLGYCIGGTFLACVLSYMKAANIKMPKSATFLTTLLDFVEVGPISALINKSLIEILEQDIKNKGYLDGKYLGNAFNLLRSNDLIWSYFINNYLMGKSPPVFDVLYWNSDSTNLPEKMYEYYIHKLYLNNELKKPGKLNMLGRPVDLTKIDCNSFFVGAKADHIAPWRSVYKGMRLLSGKKTFCLVESGHINGVINPPSSNKYSYNTNPDTTLSSLEWEKKSKSCEGSWWLYWKEWLISNSGNLSASKLSYNNLKAIEPAPGSYVKKKLQ